MQFGPLVSGQNCIQISGNWPNIGQKWYYPGKASTASNCNFVADSQSPRFLQGPGKPVHIVLIIHLSLESIACEQAPWWQKLTQKNRRVQGGLEKRMGRYHTVVLFPILARAALLADFFFTLFYPPRSLFTGYEEHQKLKLNLCYSHIWERRSRTRMQRLTKIGPGVFFLFRHCQFLFTFYYLENDHHCLSDRLGSNLLPAFGHPHSLW